MQRVFSAGTFTTAKIKSAIKDVARTHKVPVATTNYLTAILDDDLTWTDLMRLASTDKRMRDFIQKYPDVFEEMLPIMGQARSASSHASAVVIIPEYVKGERVECFDLLPIRKMGDLLVSELSGVDIDAIGILKNDVLGIKELTRMSDIIDLIHKEYKVRYTILEIASKYLNDPKVFEIIKAGHTQGIFQMSGEGITKYIKRMAPDNINDIIASVALFRPGTLDSGAAEDYVRAKRGEYEPTYLWGTYEILNETYAQMCYQEQISQVAQKVGNLSLGDGVNLVKALSKKKLEKVRKFKDKFFAGVKENGCPKEAAEQIWSNIEDAAKYSFNKCISGRERFYHDDRWMSIADIYSTARSVGCDYGMAWSMNEKGEIVQNKIKDIRYMGIKPLYRITLENGAYIDVTDNHKHPTNNGKKRTDEIKVGVDKMYFCTGKGVDKLESVLKKVVSIEYVGDDEVYDVEMNGPYHNFTNSRGIVTSNSHATSYGLTAYVGGWFKAHYPTAFYTVVLRDQDEDKMPVLMNEIKNVNGTELVQPDINISGIDFMPDFKNNRIYWSLTRIKWVGLKAVQYIVQERNLYGEFYDMEDFIKRIFKSKFKGWDDEGTPATRERCPVTARSLRNMIFAGAFDECEHLTSIAERYHLMEKAAEMLGFAIREKDVPVDLRDKHYFWSQQQINMSGMGSIDYWRIYADFEKPGSLAKYRFIEFKDLGNVFYKVGKGVVCATICEVHEKSYKDKQTGATKHFGKIDLQQNTETNILTIWDDWADLKKELKGAAGRIIIAVVNVKWSDYDEKNTLQIGKSSFLKLV